MSGFGRHCTNVMCFDLERQQYRSARMRYNFRHNDGHLGPRERARLHHRLNHTSRSIYRARHN